MAQVPDSANGGEARNLGLAVDAFDDELASLFSAFDDVSASAELKERTLDGIFAYAESAEGPGESSSETADAPEAPAEAAAEAPEDEKPKVAALAGGKPGAGKARRRAKLRAIRVAAVAACLTLALTGGVAYAVPSSHVTVSQGDASVELGVNLFGITVSATAATEAGQQVIDAASLACMPYGESLERAYDAMALDAPDEPVEVRVESREPAQRERLQGESDAFMAERRGATPESPSGSADAAPAAPSASAGSVDPSEPGNPGGPGNPEGEGNGDAPSDPGVPGTPEGAGGSDAAGAPGNPSAGADPDAPGPNGNPEHPDDRGGLGGQGGQPSPDAPMGVGDAGGDGAFAQGERPA